MNPRMLFTGLLIGLLAFPKNAMGKEMKKPTGQPELTDSLIFPGEHSR